MFYRMVAVSLANNKYLIVWLVNKTVIIILFAYNVKEVMILIVVIVYNKLLYIKV